MNIFDPNDLEAMIFLGSQTSATLMELLALPPYLEKPSLEEFQKRSKFEVYF